MDPRRLLILVAAGLAVAGCTTVRPLPTPAGVPPMAPVGAAVDPGPPSPDAADPGSPAPPAPIPETLAADPSPPIDTGLSGRAAIAAANRQARAVSRGGGFSEALQVFDWAPGRVYEVWTAPLRVTALTLEPGETVIAQAAGDTVRWQIGETVSGTGADRRGHVLIKPLEAGLETNLVLATSRRLYLVQLMSGSAESHNAVVAWRTPPEAGPPISDPQPGSAETAGTTPETVAKPVAGAARYGLRTRGRPPVWSPVEIFDDGARTYITLDPRVEAAEAPTLFVGTGDAAQLVNYRQSGATLIVDRLFDRAELRGGGTRAVVEIHRLEEDRP